MNSRLKKLLQTLLFFSTGILILYWVYYKQNQAYMAECVLQGIAEEDCSLLKKVVNDFRNANIWVLLLVLVLFMISNISRAIRWKMLLKPLGINASLANAFLTIMLGYFANLGLPRIGEVIRAATLAKYEKTKVDKVMGTVIVDRGVDVIIMLLVILTAMIGATGILVEFIKNNNALSDKISNILSNPLVLISFLVLFIVLLFVFLSKKVRQSTVGIKISSFLKGMLDGLKSVMELEKPWLFVFHSFVIWIMYYLMLFVGFSAFAPTSHLGPMAGLVVFTLGSFGIVIPSPGGMGTYHFLVTAGLLMYGVNGADGFSFANILFFTIQIFGNIFFGILALLFLPLINNKNK